MARLSGCCSLDSIETTHGPESATPTACTRSTHRSQGHRLSKNSGCTPEAFNLPTSRLAHPNAVVQ